LVKATKVVKGWLNSTPTEGLKSLAVIKNAGQFNVLAWASILLSNSILAWLSFMVCSGSKTRRMAQQLFQSLV
jgi:hypothetical protein